MFMMLCSANICPIWPKSRKKAVICSAVSIAKHLYQSAVHRWLHDICVRKERKGRIHLKTSKGLCTQVVHASMCTYSHKRTVDCKRVCKRRIINNKTPPFQNKYNKYIILWVIKLKRWKQKNLQNFQNL